MGSILVGYVRRPRHGCREASSFAQHDVPDPQSGQERYATEIRADSMQMLGGRAGQGGQGGSGGYAQDDSGFGSSAPAAGGYAPAAPRASAPRPAPMAAPAAAPAPMAPPAPQPASGFNDFGDDDIPF